MSERLTQGPRIEYEGAPIKGELISSEKIAAKVTELADRIYEDYKGKELVLIGILKGASRFKSDLMAELGRGNKKTGRKPRNVKEAHLGTSSYGSEITSSGDVKKTLELDTDIEGKHAIVVEDIIDTGHTLKDVLEYLEGKGPASLEVCVLLDKAKERQVEVETKYVGFEIPSVFVVGYGLDFDEDYRNLPNIAIVDTSRI